MKRFLGNLFIASGTVGAAVAILNGFESVLRSTTGKQSEAQPLVNAATPVEPDAVATSKPAPEEAVTLAPKADSERNFSIKRTKSEVGYVYWILEGYGKYKCFMLCDSWDEAVAQAKARLAEVDAVESITSTTVPQPVTTRV